MYIKLIFKETTINNKEMYSLRLYKYRDSYVLYKPTVHAFCSLLLTHTLWYRHTCMTFLPPDLNL